jgi:hypothetical protein
MHRAPAGSGAAAHLGAQSHRPVITRQPPSPALIVCFRINRHCTPKTTSKVVLSQGAPLPASGACLQCSGTPPFKDASFHVILLQGAPPPGELAQAQFVIGVLLGKHDPQLLDAYLQTLEPGLLADVVIANMARLPQMAAPAAPAA